MKLSIFIAKSRRGVRKEEVAPLFSSSAVLCQSHTPTEAAANKEFSKKFEKISI